MTKRFKIKSYTQLYNRTKLEVNNIHCSITYSESFSKAN